MPVLRGKDNFQVYGSIVPIENEPLLAVPQLKKELENNRGEMGIFSYRKTIPSSINAPHN